VAYERFVTRLLNRESHYVSRLDSLNLNHGPALFLRHNQLLLINWLREMRTHNTLPILPVPDFVGVFNLLNLQASSWVPVIPSRYLSLSLPKQPPHVPRGGGSGGDVDPGPTPNPGGPKTKAMAVFNTAINPVFDEFKVQLGKTKLNDAIKKGGNPPTVERYCRTEKQMKTISMCGSYHLRGQCNSKCLRSLDHGTHNDEEDQRLHAWCVVALA
jgi:hypothetical protein